MTSLSLIEAQVYPQPLGLYIRMQDIVLFGTRYDFLSHISSRYSSIPLWMLDVCLHENLVLLVAPVIQSLHDGEVAEFTYTCYICRTNAQFNLCGFDSNLRSS
jgi:hypothetical protein